MLGVYQEGRTSTDSLQVWLRVLPKASSRWDPQVHFQLLRTSAGEANEGQPSNSKGQTRTDLLSYYLQDQLFSDLKEWNEEKFCGLANKLEIRSKVELCYTLS